MAVTVLVLLVGFAWVGPPAHACSCARNVPSLREYFDASDLAVEGHVTGQRFDLGGPGPFDDFRVYTFAVDRVVKDSTSPDGTTAHDRWKVSLELRSGRWLVANLEAVA